MSDKLYLVCELGYEYDDNNYYRGDGSGSYPRTAYKSQEKARQVCEELNLSEFKSMFDSRDILHYGDFDWILPNTDKSNAVFERLFNTTAEGWWDNSDVDFVIQPTEDDWKELYNCFDVSWYTVTNVKMEDSD